MSALRPNSTSDHCRCARRRRMMAPKLTAYLLVILRRGMKRGYDRGRTPGKEVVAWLRCSGHFCLIRVSIAQSITTREVSQVSMAHSIMTSESLSSVHGSFDHDQRVSLKCPWLI